MSERNMSAEEVKEFEDTLTRLVDSYTKDLKYIRSSDYANMTEYN